MTARTRLRVALGTIFVFGIVLVVVPWHEIHGANHEELLAPWAVRLIEGVGEALAIAAILGWFVDEAAKRELLENVLDDISAHIAGRLLEPRLRELIETYLKADLVRTKWDITYVISDWPGQPADTEYKKLVTRFDYEMENRSATRKAYECVYEVEKSLFPEIGQAKILTVTGRTLVGEPDNFSSSEQSDGFFETESNLGFKWPVTIWPSPSVDSDAHRRRTAQLAGDKQPSYAIHTESEELVREGSILPFFAKRPALKTTLTIEYAVERMDVWVELSVGLLDKSEEGKLLPAGNGKKWEFMNPLLPGQGFTVRFKRKPGLATASAPASGRHVQA